MRARMAGMTAMAAALVVLAATAAPGQTRVRSANFDVLYLTPLYVAKEQGFFTREGLDVQMVPVKAGRLGTTALIAGEVEISQVDLREAILARQQGKQILRIYSVANRMTMDFIVRNAVLQARNLRREQPLLERFKALKGMKIGITAPGALSDVVTRFYLKRAGLDPDRDAQLVAIGGGNLPSALRTGQIDGYMLSPPTPLWLEREGVGRIIIKSSAGDVPEFAEYEYVGVSVMKGYAERHEGTLRAFVRAMNAANRFWRAPENLEKAVDAGQRYFTRVPREIIRLSILDLKESLSPDGVIRPSAIKQYMDFERTAYPGQFSEADLNPAEGVYWTNRFNPGAR
ncbi:MAG: ABC transporter substrate-binding protein [Deltaproteobacteria bacterium]|nr:ABC transporter substrate-binding protein [Deltaproteobacteria bacterium]MBI3076822.1 ABC transporter substrate-binding protein [Deltaproteobacteria bacterium]